MSQIAKSDGYYINKLSEAFFNGHIDQLTKATLRPKLCKPDGRAKAEAKRARRNAKRAQVAINNCVCLNENGAPLRECDECPR